MMKKKRKLTKVTMTTSLQRKSNTFRDIYCLSKYNEEHINYFLMRYQQFLQF